MQATRVTFSSNHVKYIQLYKIYIIPLPTLKVKTWKIIKNEKDISILMDEYKRNVNLRYSKVSTLQQENFSFILSTSIAPSLKLTVADKHSSVPVLKELTEIT